MARAARRPWSASVSSRLSRVLAPRSRVPVDRLSEGRRCTDGVWGASGEESPGVHIDGYASFGSTFRIRYVANKRCVQTSTFAPV